MHVGSHGAPLQVVLGQARDCSQLTDVPGLPL